MLLLILFLVPDSVKTLRSLPNLPEEIYLKDVYLNQTKNSEMRLRGYNFHEIASLQFAENLSMVNLFLFKKDYEQKKKKNVMRMNFHKRTTSQSSC